MLGCKSLSVTFYITKYLFIRYLLLHTEVLNNLVAKNHNILFAYDTFGQQFELDSAVWFFSFDLS